MRVAKTKALISFAVTAKLICAFVFSYADCWFSHGAAHLCHLQLFAFWVILCDFLSLQIFCQNEQFSSSCFLCLQILVKIHNFCNRI